MNSREIAFISCVNDEQEYAECVYYLERLYVPEGYRIDRICIQEAPSMAAGYNAAMESSDAKYKVYLHQDVFIRNRNFITDMLNLFSCDERIGMMGVIGKKRPGTTALGMSEWDAGKVIYDNVIVVGDEIPENERFVEVSAADGLLLATQYDISWRDDIFDGWDFYDFSQCMEFRKAGYKVVVPQQEDVWCCHDAVTSNLARYFDYYERFLQEYKGTAGISGKRTSEELLGCRLSKEQSQEIAEFIKEIKDVYDLGEKECMRHFFQNEEFRKVPHLKEYRLITHIDEIEEQERSGIRFWSPGMSASQLLRKLRTLKYALKRIEYGADEVEKMNIKENYSKYAVAEVCRQYVIDQGRIYKKRRDLFD